MNINVLELTSRSQFIPAKGFEKNIELLKIKRSSAYNYNIPATNDPKTDWWENLAWNKDVLTKFLAYPEVHFFVALYQGEVIGSFDILILPDRQVEIKNFGFTNDYVDFEVRAMFLSKVVDYCFQFDPKRIFFMASEFDQLSAISNYLSQGFTLSSDLKSKESDQIMQEKSILKSNFLINLN